MLTCGNLTFDMDIRLNLLFERHGLFFCHHCIIVVGPLVPFVRSSSSTDGRLVHRSSQTCIASSPLFMPRLFIYGAIWCRQHNNKWEWQVLKTSSKAFFSFVCTDSIEIGSAIKVHSLIKLSWLLQWRSSPWISKQNNDWCKYDCQ